MDLGRLRRFILQKAVPRGTYIPVGDEVTKLYDFYVVCYICLSDLPVPGRGLGLPLALGSQLGKRGNCTAGQESN